MRYRVQLLSEADRGGGESGTGGSRWRNGPCAMTAPPRIRNVVFDIGWVLVRLDYRPLLDFLRAHGAQLADRDAVMSRIRLEDHETGQLAGHGLLERLRELTGSRAASLEELRV